jgi:hypothetical protein
LVSNLKSFEEKFVIVNAKVLKSHVNIWHQSLKFTRCF